MRNIRNLWALLLVGCATCLPAAAQQAWTDVLPAAELVPAKVVRAQAGDPTLKAILTHPLGDVNGDKTVNASDVTVLANYILGGSPATFYSVAADMNKDEAVNASDLTSLSAFILTGGTTEEVTEATKDDDYSDQPQL